MYIYWTAGTLKYPETEDLGFRWFHFVFLPNLEIVSAENSCSLFFLLNQFFFSDRCLKYLPADPNFETRCTIETRVEIERAHFFSPSQAWALTVEPGLA